MRNILLSVLVTLLMGTTFAQHNLVRKAENAKTSTETRVDLNDQGTRSIDLSYSFDNTLLIDKTVENQKFSILRREGFTHTKEEGKPAVPCHNELIAVPLGATPKIKIHNLDYHEVAGPVCYPAQAPAPDSYQADMPEFTFDKEFYTKDMFYPEAPIEIVETLKWRGMEILIVEIRPVLYNPAQQKYRLYSNIDFSVEFNGGSEFIDSKLHSNAFLKRFPATLLNQESIKREIAKEHQPTATPKNTAKDYIIVTTNEFYEAAEMLAGWKRQLGYGVEIVAQATWTTTEVQDAISNRYLNWTPKPDYFVIIGDHQDVPAVSMGSHVTDLYYACMDGGGDFWPDMARGRISVSSSYNAKLVVQKIIDYESEPVNVGEFYSTGLHAAYFQESSTSGYAERRFAQTAEEILQYMEDEVGKTVNRVFVTESTVTPTNWNNGLYSSGEALPSHLLKPSFPWDGDANHITNYINQGSLWVLHRDHGFENGWGDPYYDISNITSLSNGDLTPIVFSINCLTGKFNETECFTERFLRKCPGGAVGIFGHSEVSYSGYNDGLAFGLFDAIWSSPGLVPNFTGSGGVSFPNVNTHEPILSMGDVLIHGLLRMTETWASNQYTNELFHYFGDPAMKIWADGVPSEITATFTNTINCNADTVIEISNATIQTGMATLVVDGELLARTELVAGAGTLNFPPVAGQEAFITISAENHKPLVTPVYVIGGCPKAKFNIGPSQFCPSDSVYFQSVSTGTISTYTWDFGPGAVPQTATSEGPHTVFYNTSGPKTITLLVDGTAGNDIYDREITIDTDCKFYMPTTGTAFSDFCYGVLYDDGGTSNYSDETNGTFVIQPEASSSITLYFSEFNFEQDWDTLWIIDGDLASGTVIGGFTGNTLPNGGIINSTQDMVTIIQQTDQGVNESGFELSWTCNYPNTAPHSDFICIDYNPCMGDAIFFDISTNTPDTWFWDFGDGNTSTLQNPTHTYESNGTFAVTLVASNIFGTDTVTRTGIVEIDRPLPPHITDSIAACGTGTIELSAISNGSTNWYDSKTATTPLDTGISYLFNIDSTTTLWVENQQQGNPEYGAKFNNAGGGGYFSYNSSHYLVFDVWEDFILKSVRVYAEGDGNRTIELRDANGSVLETTTTYIPDGEQQVELNWDLVPGTDYQLAASASPYLYRNNSSCTYPYDIAGMGQVTGSSASSSPTGYYYFFYDWEVIGPDCYSPRIPYSVFMFEDDPIADFTLEILNDSVVEFTNASSNALYYTWMFGDGNNSTDDNPAHQYASIGHYDVYLIADNPCGSDTISMTIAVGIEDIGSESNKVLIYPNPAKDEINISIQQAKAKNQDIQLYSITGQLISRWTLTANEKHISLPVSGINPGMYWIKLGDNYTQRIVIQK